MKTLIKLCLAIALFALPAFGQYTTVTGAVLDPSGNPYANGTLEADFVAGAGCPVPPQLSVSGSGPASSFQTSKVTVLDSGGNIPANFTLADNNQVTCAGSTWKFAACSLGVSVQGLIITPKVCFNVTGVTVTGASQSLTATLQAGATALTPTTMNLVTCGTTTTCSGTKLTANKLVQGTVALSGGTATITAMPAFSSTTSYVCVATDTTAAAATKTANVSTTSFTITGTTTDTVAYVCVGQ